MAVTVIKEGASFYSGRHASVPERAGHDIHLPEGWAMFAFCPDDDNKADPAVKRRGPAPSSAGRNFLLQPERGGGITTFATI